nr:EAL domain-containing protein [Sphingomonas sp.]
GRRWPWPRAHHAEMIDRLTQAGARKIYFDILFEGRSNPQDDGMLAEAIKRSRRVVLPVRGESGPHGLAQPGSGPMQMFTEHAELASINVEYNYYNVVWRLPYSLESGGKRIPSLAASLAGHEGGTGEFSADYSVEPMSIPHIGADKVLAGQFDERLVKGKDVVIGTNSKVIGDQFFIPGVGKMGGVYIQLIGAETLKQGKPVQLGWIPAFLLALALAALALLWRRHRNQSWILGAATAVLLVAPIALEARLIFVDVTPGLFVILTVWAVLVRRRIRSGGLTNPVSGLPNLGAMSAHKAGRDRAIIAARVLNYAEALATLPPDSERELVEQIVSRLRVGQPERILYQGDGGIFAWFEEPRLPFGNHIEAVHSLFRNPARVSGLSIDLSLSFGVEVGSSRSLANRLASAQVAAEEAAHDGLKWKFYDPESLEDASWKLSMLSQLDSAVDKGEVWVTYQPKLDLKSRRIVGAEALARWTHPHKGPIAASEFIAAAEQHDRIGKLTDFVLEQAIGAAARVNRKHPGFGIAVNLSARLLADKGLILRLRAMLARHGLPAELLTLELTETAALGGSGSAFDMLTGLRELGVTIAIDDYGTGLSTLDYLKKIPASEIKIDQSFVKAMLDTRSDRVMVQSTIALAHSLGRRVVAEGVEQQAVLEALVEMNCDVAQGFVVGRPMSLESLVKRLSSSRSSRVA